MYKVVLRNILTIPRYSVILFNLPAVYGGIIYGGKQFIEETLSAIERRKRAKESRERRQSDRKRIKELGFENILAGISKFYQVKEGELVRGRSKQITQLRHQLIYLLRRYSNLSLADIRRTSRDSPIVGSR